MSDNPGRHNAAALRLEYDGELGALYRIFLVNLGLTVITLGIFRFWSKTRMRRYLWAHMRFGGERFEYTGTGGEKFRGFLLALVILGCIFAFNYFISFVAQYTRQQWFAIFSLPVSLFYASLFGAAVYGAQRYRLTRSLWRGIHGGMENGAFEYGLRSMGYYLLTALSLGFAWPLFRLRMLRRRLNASAFGSARLSVAGRAGPLFWPFLLGGLFGVVLLVVVLVALGLLAWLLFGAQIGAMPGQTFSYHSVWLGIVYLLVVFSAFRLAMAWFDAAFARQILGSMALGDIRFATEITGGALFRLRLGNTLISAFTLGLGGPIVTQR
jgi:uncharacterized membrane protein YjgN (DUF898 family)